MMDTGACTRTSKRNKVKKMNQMKMGNFTVWEENVVNQKVLLSISGPNENFSLVYLVANNLRCIFLRSQETPVHHILRHVSF